MTSPALFKPRNIRSTLVGTLADGSHCVLRVQTRPSESPFARAAALLVRQNAPKLESVITLLHGWPEFHRYHRSADPSLEPWPWADCLHWIDDKDLFEGQSASRVRASQRLNHKEERK